MTTIPITQIEVQEDHNPRLDFDADEHKRLTASIKQHGVLTPLTVRKNGKGYKLVAGERRLRAAKAAGLKEVPIHDLGTDGENDHALALVENLVRDDLDPIEEAKGYEKHGGSSRALAKALNVPEARIKQRLALLALPERTQEHIAAGRVPLHAAASLLLIAEKAPTAADAISDLVAEGHVKASAVADEPDQVLRHAISTRRGEAPRCPECDGDGYIEGSEADYENDGFDDTCMACGGSGEGKAAGNAEALPLVELGYSGPDSYEDYAGLLTTAQIAELNQRLDDAIPYEPVKDQWGQVKQSPEGLARRRIAGLAPEQKDAASAYGATLNLARSTWLTDPEWTFATLIDNVAGAEAVLKEAVKQFGRTSGKPVVSESEADAERERKRKEREKEAKQAEAHHKANLEMGLALAKKHGSVKLTKDTARLLAYMILGGRQYESVRTARGLATSGLRYVNPDLQGERQVGKKTKRTLCDGDEAEKLLWEWIDRGATPEEIIGRTIQAILAGVYAYEDAAPTKKERVQKGSSYSLPSGSYDYLRNRDGDGPGDDQLNRALPALIEKFAKGVVPEARIKEKGGRTR